ncbi:hypothetical protein [Methylotenera sp.]|uniref:hypothetical protein n=1 Tax=Methylotenera sp. TaxID=2051956 RepID=UPI002735C5ED|nr:hypothetical protein [Methylotenera sp.]MDP3211578.1 hypothetical protein [Methylotenera sp.]
MKKRTLNTLISTAFITSLCLTAISAMAGPDLFQQQLNQRFMETQQKLKAAKAAKGVERQKLMSEHMKMMHEAIDNLKAMKPKAGMSMQEHEDWLNEHQKLMNQVMGQMMEEHHLLMNSGH